MDPHTTSQPDVDVEQIIRDYLPNVVHMSLATCKDNKPWVCEVHFAYDDGLHLYFRSLASRRHSQELAANPFVAGNIVRQFALGEPVVGVYFEGTAQQLTHETDQQTAAACIKERLRADDSIVQEAKDPAGHQFYKITVTNWYVFGKFNTERGQKYQLSWATPN